MKKLLDMTFDALTSQGLSNDDILEILKRTDPYRTNMEMVHSILDRREDLKNDC